MGKYGEAIECYDKALEIDPDEAGVWYNTGIILILLGRYEEAVECYDKALEINPELEIALKNKAEALEKLGEK